MNQQITLEQILETVETDERLEWNCGSTTRCPAAVTGQRIFNPSFSMFEHAVGFYSTKPAVKSTNEWSFTYAENNGIKVTVPEVWWKFTAVALPMLTKKVLIQKLKEMLASQN